MGKNKLKKWAELEEFSFVIQPSMEEVFGRDHPLKGRWHRDIFRNNNPLVLELGCGKGEYTTGLAESDRSRNYLGIDIKGARMWRGAKTANEKGLKNVAFLRTRIEFITSLFGKDEVDEIWITFPDPQLKKRRADKRLTSPRFLNSYRKFLKPGGLVHLKTDNQELYSKSMAVLEHNRLDILMSSDDIYGGPTGSQLPDIVTHYEKMFLAEGIPIKYIRFRLNNELQPWQPDDDE